MHWQQRLSQPEWRSVFITHNCAMCVCPPQLFVKVCTGSIVVSTYNLSSKDATVNWNSTDQRIGPETFSIWLWKLSKEVSDAKDLLNCLMVYIFANILNLVKIRIQLNTKQQKAVLIIKFGTCSTCAKFWITINLLSPPQWPEYLNNVFSCQFVFKLRFFIAQLKALP